MPYRLIKRVAVKKLENPEALAVLEQSKNTSRSLVHIHYSEKALGEIIDEFSEDFKTKTNPNIDNIKKCFTTIDRYQKKVAPKNFYNLIRNELRNIRNITNEICEIAKPDNFYLANNLRTVILDWIEPLQEELDEIDEISEKDRAELELKTKQLYAEQSLVSEKETQHHESLIKHLGNLQKLLTLSKRPSYPCYIIYAPPFSKKNKDREYWVKPFLMTLYVHLSIVGVRMIMDEWDLEAGGDYYRFLKGCIDGYAIFAGTRSLKEAHYDTQSDVVKTALNKILDKFERDSKEYNQSRIYPMLLDGTLKTAYPESYGYRKIPDIRQKGGYIAVLKELIDWIYHDRILLQQEDYLKLWQNYEKNDQPLLKDLISIDKEISKGYHRQEISELKHKNQEYVRIKTGLVESIIKAERHGQSFFNNHGQQFQQPSISPFFVERKKLLEDIEKSFAKTDTLPLILIVYGLGGIGKTDLAKHYYLYPPRRYDLRVWFEINSKEGGGIVEQRKNLCSQYISLYEQYIKPIIKDTVVFSTNITTEEKAKKVRECLEMKLNLVCLLVYDDISAPEVVYELLPKKGNHHILITSRNEMRNLLYQSVNVDVMKEHEAMQLINVVARTEEDNQDKSTLRRLVNTLGCLPLALVQAGTYIREKQWSLEDYLSNYAGDQSRLLSVDNLKSRAIINISVGVWDNFSLNFEELEVQNRLALLVLKKISWINNVLTRDILYKIIEDTEGAKNKNLLELWSNITSCISSYSFVQVGSEKQWTIHPLVQDIIRCWQQPITEQVNVFKNVSCLFSNFSVGSNFRCENLFPHLERLHLNGQMIAHNRHITYMHAQEVLEQIKTVYLSIFINKDFLEKFLVYCMGHLKKYEDQYDKKYGLEEARILRHVGEIYHSLEKFKDSEEQLTNALEILETQYNPYCYTYPHYEVAINLHQLVVVCIKLKNYKKAQTYLQRAQEIYYHHFAEEGHPNLNFLKVETQDLVHSLKINNIDNLVDATRVQEYFVGIELYYQGIKHYQLREYETVLSIFKEALEKFNGNNAGVFRKRTAFMNFIIGSIYLEKTKYSLALPHLEHCYILYSDLLGSENDTLTGINECLILCKEEHGKSVNLGVPRTIANNMTTGRVFVASRTLLFSKVFSPLGGEQEVANGLSFFIQKSMV